MEQEALQLKNEGYTYQEIADQLGISKTGAFRLLQKAGKPKNTLYPEKTNQEFGNSNPYQEQLELKRLELEHEREMVKLRLQERELELKEQGIYGKNNEFTEQEDTELNDEELAYSLLSARKEKLLKRFKELVKTFLVQIDGFKWNEEDITNFIEKSDNLQNAIEETTILDGSDFNSMVSYNVLDFINSKLNNGLSELQEESESLLGFGHLFSDGHISISLEEEEKEYLENALSIDDLGEKEEFGN